MAIPASITANQHNASPSTGPKTQEGKGVAARNATKHGLSGAFAVLPHEDRDEFDIRVACLRHEFKPAGEHQYFRAEQMAQSRRRLARAGRLETAMFDQMLKGSIPADDDQRIAAKAPQLRKSRHLQNEPNPTGHRPLTTGNCLPNEPKSVTNPTLAGHPLPGRSPRPLALESIFAKRTRERPKSSDFNE